VEVEKGFVPVSDVPVRNRLARPYTEQDDNQPTRVRRDSETSLRALRRSWTHCPRGRVSGCWRSDFAGVRVSERMSTLRPTLGAPSAPAFRLRESSATT